MCIPEHAPTYSGASAHPCEVLRVAVLNGFTALGIPFTEAVG